MRQMVLSILVENSAGVLSRVAGLFSRRGYNIDSLTVGVTNDPKFSRMTVVASGSEDVLDQIKKQLAKLVDVKEIVELPSGASVLRELVLVQVEATVEQRQAVIAIADIYRAKIVDVSDHSIMLELTGNQDKLRAFLELMEGFKITELARTGVTGLARGTANLK
ncbi:MAG: acetolactate synthase small subunit [Thermoflexaceae bacterium]|nr:acetolactate synthase small subunit [Thermoflexaceae bacterium]